MAIIKTNNNTYQVMLRVNGINTSVNVFANNSAQAVINAKNQVNPRSPASVGLVSVTPINACSISVGGDEGPVGSISTRGSINY